MNANIRSGFNRLFVILTGAWVAYCLLVYPLQEQRRAAKRELKVFDECYRADPHFKACSDYAIAISRVNEWPLKTYWKRESWFLGLVIIAVPLLVYGVCRVVGVLSVWVWRGFSGSSA